MHKGKFRNDGWDDYRQKRAEEKRARKAAKKK